MRYLTRNKIYNKLEPSRTAKKVYIFCEGQKREVEYFNFFQGLSSNIDIIAIPSDNGNTDPEKLKNNAINYFFKDSNTEISDKLNKEYDDEVWFVIDTDRWNEGNKIANLRSFIHDRNNKYSGWYVAQSNPSFEVWLYYHFFSDKPANEDVSNYSSFKDFTNSKIRGGFDSRKMPLRIETAIQNSELNFESDRTQPLLYSTEVFALGKLILSFTKDEIDICLKTSEQQPLQ